MFNPFRQEDPQLESAIAAAYEELKNSQSDHVAYAAIVKQITKLNNLKNQGVDPNVLLTVAGNLLVTIAVLKFEQTGVITTKLLSFLVKK